MKLFVYNFAMFKNRFFKSQRFSIHSCLLDSIAYMKTNYNLHTESDETPKKRLENMAATLPCFSFKNKSTPVLSYAYQIYMEFGHVSINVMLSIGGALIPGLLLSLDREGIRGEILFKPTSLEVGHVFKLTNDKI